ncbi:MAG: LUD domain-containing protein [Chthoniobacterales bacterium]
MTDSSSDTRKAILERVRKSTSLLPEKTPYPDYPNDVARSAPHLQEENPLENFRKNFETAHGIFFDTVSKLKEYLLKENFRVGFCDPALLDIFHSALAPEIELTTTFDRSRIDVCAFGITRAAGAIAETGTIILNDETTCTRLGALAPWVHVAIISPKLIHETIGDAISALGKDPNTIWATGPSKTADVEGILIEGVHGPGVQACLFI